MDDISQRLLMAGGGAQPGQVEFASGASWVVPSGVYSICAVCVSSGAAASTGPNSITYGGWGGTLAYANDIPVSPGETLTIQIDTTAAIKRGSTPLIGATPPTTGDILSGATAGGMLGSGTSFSGGAPGSSVSSFERGGGGGAGGYSGPGGAGGIGSGGNGSNGSGGGGGGGKSNGAAAAAYGGGGVGLKGAGTSGLGSTTSQRGGAGSGGFSDGRYGGGGSFTESPGGAGLRIIWGAGRSYPNNAGDV